MIDNKNKVLKDDTAGLAIVEKIKDILNLKLLLQIKSSRLFSGKPLGSFFAWLPSIFLMKF